MNSKIVRYSVWMALCLAAGVWGWAQTPEASKTKPQDSTNAPSAPALAPIDLPALIKAWEKRRDEARDRWLQHQRGFQGSGRPGPTAAAINQDRGLQEAADGMVRELKKLQETAHTEAERRAGLSKLRDEWLKVRESTFKRWDLNRRFMPGSGRTGLTAAEINNAAGWMEALDWMFSDLETYLGKLPKPTLPTSPADLARGILDRLPKGIVSEGQLDEFLNENKDNPELGLTDELIREVKELFRTSRREQLARLQALAGSLRDTPVSLTSSPASPVPWDPSAKNINVKVSTDEEAVRGPINGMREVVRRLTGVGPEVKVWYVWKATGGQELDSGPTYESTLTVPIQGPKPITVTAIRHVRVEAEPAEEDSLAERILAVTDKVHSAQGSLTVEVKPLEFPTEIAGRWTGSLVIGSIPILAGWPEDVAQPPTASDDPLEALGEGCSIPPEAFTQMRRQLEQLQGQSMAMTIDVKPANVFAGQATLNVTPPQGVGAVSAEPLTHPYRYANGVLTIEGTKDQLTLTMTGTFAPASAGWKVSGSWLATGQIEGKRIVAMKGTWTATNPSAK